MKTFKLDSKYLAKTIHGFDYGIKFSRKELLISGLFRARVTDMLGGGFKNCNKRNDGNLNWSYKMNPTNTIYYFRESPEFTLLVLMLDNLK